MNSALVIGAGLLFACLVLWLLTKKSQKVGLLKSENSQLRKSQEQAEEANDVDITIDRLTAADKRKRLRDDWSK